MKKLICAKDVESCVQKGEAILYIDSNTLITPSARDAAAQANIEFREGCCPAADNSCGAAETSSAATSDNDIIYKACLLYTSDAADD